MPSDDRLALLLDSASMEQVLDEMARSIYARWIAAPALAFVGVHRRGIPFASRLAQRVQALGKAVEFGKLDITLYRDDVASQPIPTAMEGSDLPFDLDDAVIILCDEVIYTGRTTRAALDALLDYGRPRCIEIAALIDRPGRELPIFAAHAGRLIDIPDSQRVNVHFTETDGTDEVFTSLRDNPL
jgi:pyrimidine operon attenuation protein / uracil phosphoribosyltransferase